MMNRRDTEQRIFLKRQKRSAYYFYTSFVFSAFLCLCGLVPAFAQNDLPNEIRGYKVYRAKIAVRNASEQNEQNASDKKDYEASVRLGDPQPTTVTISGVSFNISAEIFDLQQSGKIDFLAFQDFRVNDLPVEIEEYRESFELSKNKIIRLPKPVKITVAYRHALFGVLEEQFNSKKYWQVTGRIFVFGSFKKGWFKFKRVIPVEINLQIRNPRIIGHN